MIALILTIIVIVIVASMYDDAYHAKRRADKAKRMQDRIIAAKQAYRPKYRSSKPNDFAD